MPLEKPSEQSPRQPIDDEEALKRAEAFAGFARQLYSREEKLADTAALVSLAWSSLVIARQLAAQTGLMQEVHLPDLSVPPVEPSTGLEGE